MKYELINPSDEIYFDAENDEVAFFCVLMIGGGKFSAKNTETEWSSPFYLFGISSEALDIELEMDAESFINIHRDDINKCMQSFRYVRERTSMSKIVDRAHGLILK